MKETESLKSSCTSDIENDEKLPNIIIIFENQILQSQFIFEHIDSIFHFDIDHSSKSEEAHGINE
jgi:hypothetical protein